MEMGNRFAATSADPVHRLVLLTQASLETARRFSRAREITAELGRCDPRLCRIRLHPIGKEISHFRHELATARRLNRTREINAEPGRCDPRLWRIRLHPTEREISRFRQELANTVRPPIRDVFEPSRRFPEPDRPPDPLSSPPTKRKAYAPDPIGKPAEPREVPPDVAESLHLINYFRITNEGSLIDLLV